MSNPVKYTNDGSTSEPYLRTDFNLGGLTDLPEWSDGPRGSLDEKLAAIQAAGYRGVQGADVKSCTRHGLGATTSGRVDEPGDARRLAETWSKAGYQAGTLHVGTGVESDDEIDRLVQAIVAASNELDVPLYIETHRATITQDMYRTVRMIERNPNVRINADFSHWYTGQEMPYGDWDAKMSFLSPVFERVAFMHGRLGNSSCMQVTLDDPSMEQALDHYRDMWTRAMAGFLRNAGPGDYLSFNPEILHPAINYARRKEVDGEWIEESDRWREAEGMTKFAVECFDAAREQVGKP